MIQAAVNSTENFDSEIDLALAVIVQAFTDLVEPTEADDAFEFLTVSLWRDNRDGLPYRALFPSFIESQAARDRLWAMAEDVRARRRPVPAPFEIAG